MAAAWSTVLSRGRVSASPCAACSRPPSVQKGLCKLAPASSPGLRPDSGAAAMARDAKRFSVHGVPHWLVPRERRGVKKLGLTATRASLEDPGDRFAPKLVPEQRARFEGVERTYGSGGLRGLQAAHVCVVGVGGVGSWTAEALARSGVGQLTLVDLDEVCISNINRQIHALQHTVGQPKCAVMTDRIRAINPDCVVQVVNDFLTADNRDAILGRGYDYVVDCIDTAENKALIIDYCFHRRIPVVSTGGTGGIPNPLGVRVEDMTQVSHNTLAAATRKRLRQVFGFPQGTKKKMNAKQLKKSLWKVPVVYVPDTQKGLYEGTVARALPPSIDVARPSPPFQPEDASCELAPAAPGQRLGCAGGSGSVVFVTGTVGFFAAAYVVEKLSEWGNSGEGAESSAQMAEHSSAAT